MFWGKGRKKGIFREHDSLVMEAAWEAKLGHIVGKRSLGRAKQGQENRGNGARRTETRASYDWEAIFSLIIYIALERRKWTLRARAPPPALLGEAKNQSSILRDGLGAGSGRKAAREQANFSCKSGNRTTALE